MAPNTSQRGRNRIRADHGFTLIELIVVMVIIGVLAAVALPVYRNQQMQAVDTSLKVDVKKFADSVQTWFVDYDQLPLVYYLGKSPNGNYRLGARQPNGRPFEFLELSPGTVWNNAGPGWFANRYNWCLSLYNERGKTKMFRYRPGQGVQPGKC